jgi:hypothetical protein
MREEAQRREKKKSIIGTLIEQALFEFTSLEGGADKSVVAGADPLALGSGEDWAANLNLDGDRPSQMAVRSFDMGNLAALEEDTASGQRDRPPSVPPRSEPAPSSLQISGFPQSPPHPLANTMPSTPSSVPMPVPMPLPPQGNVAVAAPKSGGKGGLIALLLLLLIAGGLVGAYFAGLIPPSIIRR